MIKIYKMRGWGVKLKNKILIPTFKFIKKQFKNFILNYKNNTKIYIKILNNHNNFIKNVKKLVYI